ncbi:MAG TPA: helix-turn-helix domain-containing protein [Nitrososphaeraceae archaeon]|nr:helix-turn-helix domain-containing protein [Nitrososphaeraceae archaeon]
MISKQQYEAQLQHIFRLLLENKTQEEIAGELHISSRTVTRYSQRIEKRYGQMQRQKTDDTMFLECNLLKNRLLTLYKALETQVTSDKTSGTEKTKCAEVAANIAIDVLKMESEGIRAVIEIISKNNTNKGQRGLENLGSQLKNDESDNIKKEYNPNRKF